MFFSLFRELTINKAIDLYCAFCMLYAARTYQCNAQPSITGVLHDDGYVVDFHTLQQNFHESGLLIVCSNRCHSFFWNEQNI